jgi:hypothetical protein
MNKFGTTLSVALVALSIGFSITSANAGGKKGFLDVDINIGSDHRGNRGSDDGHDWAEKRRAKLDADEAAERHRDAKAKAKADYEAQQNANRKPGDKVIKATGSVLTLGDRQVKSCQQQVAIQFVHKSGGVTTVDEAKRRQAQCVTMFRD